MPSMRNPILAVLPLLSVVVAASFAVACSSATNAPPGGCTTYVVPAGTDLTTPKVSFQNDVMPIFAASCGLSTSCHGAESGPRIFLGSKTNMNGAAILAQTVGVPATELTAMSYITASDPTKSFLMHKMDGDMCTLNAQCVNGDCGLSMPQNNDLLDVSRRDTVRRWIAQGAPNN